MSLYNSFLSLHATSRIIQNSEIAVKARELYNAYEAGGAQRPPMLLWGENARNGAAVCENWNRTECIRKALDLID